MQQKVATAICQRLRDAGHIAYFAGGWVRDYVMGHPSADIDIATSATSQELMALFSHTVPVGIAFESLVVVEQGFHYEVSTFRQDVEYTNGRKPDAIALASPEEDAQRRDFTINGMFFDPLDEIIHDYVGGREDIDRGIMRAIGHPSERFREDRLRMIRGVRLAARFSFELEAETEAAIRAHAKSLFPAVAIERVWQELQKMRAYPRFDVALSELQRLGLLPVIFPELEALSVDHVRQLTAGFGEMPDKAGTILFILQLFPDLLPEETESLCRYLKVSNRDIRLAQLYRELQQAQQRSTMELADWARIYAEEGAWVCIESLASAVPLGQREAVLDAHRERSRALEPHWRRIREKTPLLCAQDLIDLGIPRGPRLGALLKEAERLSVNQNHSSKEGVLKSLQDSLLWKGC